VGLGLKYLSLVETTEGSEGSIPRYLGPESWPGPFGWIESDGRTWTRQGGAMVRVSDASTALPLAIDRDDCCRAVEMSSSRAVELSKREKTCGALMIVPEALLASRTIRGAVSCSGCSTVLGKAGLLAPVESGRAAKPARVESESRAASLYSVYARLE
jgi:hypothetical protein